MSGQTEPIVFVLLLAIVLVLVVGAVTWGKGVTQQNIDAARLAAAEQFVFDLDKKIQNIAKESGMEVIEYKLDMPIDIIDNCTANQPYVLDKCIQISGQTSLTLPEYWIYLNTPNKEKFGGFNDSASIIREIKEGNIFRIQLFYRIREGVNYTIDIQRSGATLTPSLIYIENVGIENRIIGTEKYVVTNIKMTFQ